MIPQVILVAISKITPTNHYVFLLNFTPSVAEELEATQSHTSLATLHKTSEKNLLIV
jgi:hypothetical protein